VRQAKTFIEELFRLEAAGGAFGGSLVCALAGYLVLRAAFLVTPAAR